MVTRSARPPSLARIRREIERVDRAIVLLLAARLDAAHRALQTRSGYDHRTTDPAQEKRVLQRGRTWARELGLPEALVETLFQTLIEEGKTRFQMGTHAPEHVSPSLTVFLAAPPAAPGDLVFTC